MRFTQIKVFSHFFLTLLILGVEVSGQSIEWTPGYLDIHHISSGSGNSTFMIFPDGTTLLFDAGDINRNKSRSNPLKASPPIGGDSISAATFIVNYIKNIIPEIKKLDYLVVSHFHDDHYGHINALSKPSKRGPYMLSGITEIHELLPVTIIIDRGFPDYTNPVNIAENHFDKETFLNYLSFVKFHTEHKTIQFDSLHVGETSQFIMQKRLESKHNFTVRNVKSNGNIWAGVRNDVKRIIPSKIPVNLYNENPLSIALKISYGNFDYFTGGDMTGLKGFGFPNWFDTETPTAHVVGKVEAISLNHHGVRDATNDFFLSTLNPEVIVQQSWSSNHPGEEVLHRMIQPNNNGKSPSIFATYVHLETMITYGRWLPDNYKSLEGHVLIRVSGTDEKYWVYILKNEKELLHIKNTFGPYSSK